MYPPKLRNINMGYVFLSVNIKQEESCLGGKASLGVNCNSCHKTSKKQTEYPKNCKEVLKNGMCII